MRGCGWLKQNILMNTLFRILNNQLELNDAIDSYGYWSSLSKEILEDEKGKYQIKNITEERPCSCHPETCCHFDEKITVSKKEKVYLKT